MRKVIIVLIDQSLNQHAKKTFTTHQQRQKSVVRLKTKRGGAKVAENGTFTAVLRVGSNEVQFTNE
jgi:hypothetical protein